MRNITGKIIGTLAAAIDFIYTPGGTPIAKLLIAGELNKQRADTGETVNLPFYLSVTMIGKGAENLMERRYEPGDVLCVTGQPQYESWKNDVGVQRSNVTMRALNVEKVSGEFETTTDKGDFIRLAGGVNSFSFIGNLSDDAVVGATPSGDAVCNYRLGVNESFKDGRGQQIERTHWFDYTAWREEAEAMQGAVKGQPVMVLDASLLRNTYTDKDGNEVAKRYFEVTQHALLLKRPAREGAREGAPVRSQPTVRPAPETPYIPVQSAGAGLDVDSDPAW